MTGESSGVSQLLQRLHLLVQFGDRFILALQQSVNQLLAVVLLGLLLVHFSDALVDELDLFGELSALCVFVFEVPFELGKQDQVERLHHPLQTQAQLALEADQVVQNWHEAGVKS